MADSREDMEFNRRWLVEMRGHLGWSTTEAADHARRAAADRHEELKVSQQAVSAFENGKLKSTPRWLGYVQIAMNQYLAERSLDVGEVGELRLPQNMRAFFEGRSTTGSSLTARTEDKDIEKVAAGLGLVPIREIDLTLGMGATYLDVPVTETVRHFPLDWIRNYTRAAPENLLFAQGVGDSMEPTLRDSDLLLIDCSQDRLNMADKVWAIAYANCGAVKRLRPVPSGGVEILSDNPNVPTAVAHDGEVHIFGRIVATVRKM